MLKYVVASALVVGVALAASTTIQTAKADGPFTFALVPKNVNNPFFDQAEAGCRKAEKELAGKIKCLYVGPGEHGGGDEQGPGRKSDRSDAHVPLPRLECVPNGRVRSDDARAPMAGMPVHPLTPLPGLGVIFTLCVMDTGPRTAEAMRRGRRRAGCGDVGAPATVEAPSVERAAAARGR